MCTITVDIYISLLVAIISHVIKYIYWNHQEYSMRQYFLKQCFKKKVYRSLNGAFSALQPKADCTLNPK